MAKFSRAACEHVVESFRCNIRYRPWLKFDFVMVLFDSEWAITSMLEIEILLL